MNRFTAILALAAVCGAAFAQRSAFQPTQTPLHAATNPQFQFVEQFAPYRMNAADLKTQLAGMPMENFSLAHNGKEILIPGPNGTMQRFRMFESPIATPAIERLSKTKTYAAQGIDDPWASGRFDLGPNGFHGFVTSPNGDFVIEPAVRGDLENVLSFYRRDNFTPRDFVCKTVTPSNPNIIKFLGGGTGNRPGANLKTYRLAINGTFEYTTFWGGTAVGAMNGATTTVNRVNQVYEKDHAIRMNIVGGTMWTTAADPFTNNNGFTMLGQNQTQCDTVVGSANYDIGHVFSTGGGGVAGLQVVGVTGQKGRGVTGSGFPTGDGFDIDYVAHEMGHQYGANHTFNGTTSSCGGGNRNAGTAYEPGSGSTIMGYAGICATEDLQPNSDAYQHTISQQEIENWRNNAGSMGTTTNTGNASPVVNAGADFSIPIDTPFRLTGSATDANNDSLTYCWEQFNLGQAGPAINEATSPLFRSMLPSTNSTRWFPKQSTVLNNLVDQWENLPSLPRTMNFRMTVRDNRAGGGNYDYDSNVITVVAGGAFSVTAPNTAVTWAGNSTQTVTWNVGGSTGTANVRILLSTDGGNSFYNNTATVVLASTPNDGSQTITVPNVNSTTARIIVEGVSNIFYDVSNTNFTINQTIAAPTITTISPNSATAGGAGFVLTVNGTNFINGSTVRWNGSNRTTTFVNSTQLTATISAADIATAAVIPVTVFTAGPGTSNAVNFTVNTAEQVVNPTSLTVTAGLGLNTTLSNLFTSDNLRVSVLCDEFSPNGTFEVVGTSPIASVTQVKQLVETAASRADLLRFVDMFNYTTSAFETMSSQNSTLVDSAITITVTTNPGRFIRVSDRQMRSRLRWIPLNDISALDGWTQTTDRLVWTVQ